GRDRRKQACGVARISTSRATLLGLAAAGLHRPIDRGRTDRRPHRRRDRPKALRHPPLDRGRLRHAPRGWHAQWRRPGVSGRTARRYLWGGDRDAVGRGLWRRSEAPPDAALRYRSSALAWPRAYVGPAAACG